MIRYFRVRELQPPERGRSCDRQDERLPDRLQEAQSAAQEVRPRRQVCACVRACVRTFLRVTVVIRLASLSVLAVAWLREMQSLIRVRTFLMSPSW